MNPYLKRKREEYAALQSSIEGLQTRAASENRDLTEDELRSVTEQAKTAEKLYAEIEMLTEQANRSAAVADLGANLRESAKASSTSAVDRDPGHYRSVQEGGKHSFFGDHFRAMTVRDTDATARLTEFARAQNTSDIAGVVPPKWLADQFTNIPQQSAALANATTGLPLSDARPFSLPGQTASTTVANQSSENAATVSGDDYDAAAVTVTPSTIIGCEIFSRQLLDAANPGIDQLITSDLLRVYVAERENRIGTAIRAVGTPIVVAFSDFEDHDAAESGYNVAVDAGMHVWKNMHAPATAYVMSHDAFAKYLKLKDADGRPIVVDRGLGPVNAIGTGSVNGSGLYIAGMPVVVSAGMVPTDAADQAAAAIYGPAVTWFESPGLTFRYEEVNGPESIKVGLYRYFAVAVRQGTRAVKNVLIDDDESPA